jgi:TPR repeat protein
LLKAQDLGEATAMVKLGAMVEVGGRALAFDAEAAVGGGGNSISSSSISSTGGVPSRGGGGVPKSADQATSYYRQAAFQGNAVGMFRLGLMLVGIGSAGAVDQGWAAKASSPAKGKVMEAIEWWRRAAEQDQAGALFQLGNVYLQGLVYFMPEEEKDEDEENAENNALLLLHADDDDDDQDGDAAAARRRQKKAAVAAAAVAGKKKKKKKKQKKPQPLLPRPMTKEEREEQGFGFWRRAAVLGHPEASALMAEQLAAEKAEEEAAAEAARIAAEEKLASTLANFPSQGSFRVVWPRGCPVTAALEDVESTSNLNKWSVLGTIDTNTVWNFEESILFKAPPEGSSGTPYSSSLSFDADAPIGESPAAATSETSETSPVVVDKEVAVVTSSAADGGEGKKDGQVGEGGAKRTTNEIRKEEREVDEEKLLAALVLGDDDEVKEGGTGSGGCGGDDGDEVSMDDKELALVEKRKRMEIGIRRIKVAFAFKEDEGKSAVGEVSGGERRPSRISTLKLVPAAKPKPKIPKSMAITTKTVLDAGDDVNGGLKKGSEDVENDGGTEQVLDGNNSPEDGDDEDEGNQEEVHYGWVSLVDAEGRVLLELLSEEEIAAAEEAEVDAQLKKLERELELENMKASTVDQSDSDDDDGSSAAKKKFKYKEVDEDDEDDEEDNLQVFDPVAKLVPAAFPHDPKSVVKERSLYVHVVSAERLERGRGLFGTGFLRRDEVSCRVNFGNQSLGLREVGAIKRTKAELQEVPMMTAMSEYGGGGGAAAGRPGLLVDWRKNKLDPASPSTKRFLLPIGPAAVRKAPKKMETSDSESDDDDSDDDDSSMYTGTEDSSSTAGSSYQVRDFLMRFHL